MSVSYDERVKYEVDNVSGITCDTYRPQQVPEIDSEIGALEYQTAGGDRRVGGSDRQNCAAELYMQRVANVGVSECVHINLRRSWKTQILIPTFSVHVRVCECECKGICMA